MRRLLAMSTMLAVATAGTIALAPAASATTAAETSARLTPTGFVFKVSGYGTRVRGGQVPARSGATAFQSIGCTNLAGKSRTNYEAQLDVPGLGVVSGVSTKVFTRRRDGVTSSISKQSIAQVKLGDTAMGSLSLKAVQSESRAFHDAKGFHATTNTDVGAIVLTPPTGEPQSFPVPSPGQTLTIPGVASITLGRSAKSAGSNGAVARADALLVDVVASGSRANIAHTVAKLNRGIKSGIFGGFSAGTRVDALAGVLSSGYTPLLKMPCQGTDGKVKTRSVAHLDLGGQLVVDGLATQQKATQTDTRAWGYEIGRIARVDLGQGQLVATGIVGRANVTRVGRKVVATTRGTTIGSITVDGEPHTFPDTDVIEIPGALRLERNVVERFNAGLFVIALRVTVLEVDSENYGAVIDLGQARMKIERAAR